MSDVTPISNLRELRTSIARVHAFIDGFFGEEATPKPKRAPVVAKPARPTTAPKKAASKASAPKKSSVKKASAAAKSPAKKKPAAQPVPLDGVLLSVFRSADGPLGKSKVMKLAGLTSKDENRASLALGRLRDSGTITMTGVRRSCVYTLAKGAPTSASKSTSGTKAPAVKAPRKRVRESRAKAKQTASTTTTSSPTANGAHVESVTAAPSVATASATQQ